MGGFSVPTIFTAIDKISPTISGIGDKVDKVQKRLNSVAKYALIGGTVLASGLGFAFNEAVKFEDKMADVAKVMNLDAGSKELQDVSKEVQGLSVYLAQTPEAVAELYGNIAQSGVAKAEIGAVSKLAGEMGVAFGISAGQAGESFVKLQNSMGITLKQTKYVTDAINELGNQTAAKSSELLEFMSSGGAGAARQLELAGEEAAAVGSVFISVGKSASEAGTIFERLMKGVLGKADVKRIYDRHGKGLNGIMAVLEHGQKLNPDAQFKFFRNFGEYGTDISLLSKNLDLMKKNLGFVSEASKINNSSFLEFQNRQKTMAVTLQKLKTEFTNLAIEVGYVLLPVVRDLLTEFSPYFKSFGQYISDNKEGVIVIAKLAAGLFALSGAIKAINLVLAIGKTAMVAYTAVVAAYEAVAITAALGGYTLAGAIWAVAWPVLLVLAVIALIILAFIYWDEICEWFAKQWEKFTNWIGEIWDAVVKWFEEFSFVDFFKSIGQAIIDFMLFPLRSVLELVSKIPGKIGRLAGEALELTHKLDLVDKQDSPSTTASKQTRDAVKDSKSNMIIDINDKGGNVEDIKQVGNWVPVNLNSTKFGLDI